MYNGWLIRESSHPGKIILDEQKASPRARGWRSNVKTYVKSRLRKLNPGSKRQLQ